MLGSGKSSQNVWTAFDIHSTAGTRQPRHSVSISWKRVKNESTAFATIGSSVIGGIDIIQGQLNVITEPDKFTYYDETDRVLELNYDRQVEEPLGGMVYATGSVTLDNNTKRFTPNVSDTIGTALRPGRPIKMFTGFKISSNDTTLPALYGITESPRENKENRTCLLNVFDYVSYINDYELESTIFTSQTSDQIIASLLTTIGFTSSQYSLDTGINTIGFAWFEKGTKAGAAIRKICEAEEAQFFQDEEGLLRFQNRRNYNNNVTPVWTINKEDILAWDVDTSVPLINRCIVRAKPRAVASVHTEVWRSGTAVEIGNGDTETVWATFDNPVSSFATLTSTLDYTANTASDGSGSDITGQVSITVTSFTTSAKLEIENSYAGTAYITFLRLRGKPAVIVNEIEEIFENRDSEDTYGRYQVEINNDFIDSQSFAYYLTRAIVNKYATPLKRINVTIPAQPALQVKDVVTLYDMDTNTSGSYRIMRIRGKMSQTGFLQTLTLREVTDAEADSYAVVGTATIDGPDVVGI